MGSRTLKWEQETNKVGTKWDQEPKSGNKRGTKWEQSGIKNPKVGTREEQSGNKVGSRTPKMGTREEQSGNKVGSRTQKWEQERNKVGSRTHKWEQERMSQSVLHTTSIHVRKAAVVRGSIAAQFQAAISSTLNRSTNENGILPKMYH